MRNPVGFRRCKNAKLLAAIISDKTKTSERFTTFIVENYDVTLKPRIVNWAAYNEKKKLLYHHSGLSSLPMANYHCLVNIDALHALS